MKRSTSRSSTRWWAITIYVIMLTSAAIQNVQDPGLRQTLTQALPKLEQHRQKAYQLLGQLKPKAQPQVGGAGAEGTGTESQGMEEIPQPR